MVGPIQALRIRAERIGGGDFSPRISIKTGDELEGLADQFNEMGARLQESYTDLEKKVELANDRIERIPSSNKLRPPTCSKVISRSAGELEPVFQKMLENADPSLRGEIRHHGSLRGRSRSTGRALQRCRPRLPQPAEDPGRGVHIRKVASVRIASDKAA